MASPVQDFTLLEPKLDFLLGVFDRVTAVADVSSDLDAKVSTNGSWSRFQWVGGTKHLASGGDGFLALPNHADNGSTEHVVSELGEERLFNQIGVVLFEKLLAGLLCLHGGQLVSLGFESVDDVSDDSTLNSIGFDLYTKKILALAKFALSSAHTLKAEKRILFTYHDVSSLGSIHAHGETMGNSQEGKDANSVEGVHLDGNVR